MRLEALNLFNHTEFSGVDTESGAVLWVRSSPRIQRRVSTAAYPPRIVQIALRLSL
jgi:hypothetical protein